MSRRRFLKALALIGAGAISGFASPVAFGQQKTSGVAKGPIRIYMGGYSPPSTGFSLAMKRIGDRLEKKFGKDVDVKYVYNILDLGYKGEDILWLVESGVLTLGYQLSSYLTDRGPHLGIADLPFFFLDGTKSRAPIGGPFGQTHAQRTRTAEDCRI